MLNPESPEAHYALSQIYGCCGQQNKQYSEIEKTLHYNPLHARALLKVKPQMDMQELEDYLGKLHQAMENLTAQEEFIEEQLQKEIELTNRRIENFERLSRYH